MAKPQVETKASHRFAVLPKLMLIEWSYVLWPANPDCKLADQDIAETILSRNRLDWSAIDPRLKRWLSRRIQTKAVRS